jgi:hypothetical protein
VLFQAFLAQIDHLLRRLPRFRTAAGRLVHADIGRLRGQHHRDQQLIVIAIGKLGLRVGIGFGQSTVKFENVRCLHANPIWRIRPPGQWLQPNSSSRSPTPIIALGTRLR